MARNTTSTATRWFRAAFHSLDARMSTLRREPTLGRKPQALRPKPFAHQRFEAHDVKRLAHMHPSHRRRNSIP